MKDILHIEEDTGSMALTLVLVQARDFDATEEIFRTVANFFHAYGAFLNKHEDISPEVEDIFLRERSGLLENILEATRKIHNINTQS